MNIEQLKNKFWTGTYISKEKDNLQISDKTIRNSTYLVSIQKKSYAKGGSKLFL